MGWDKKKIKLFEIIGKHRNWGNVDEEKDLQAKQALYEFYDELKRNKPDKKYRMARNSMLHVSYFHYLVQIKKALMEQRYAKACHELGSLIYHEPFFQGRIYHNVVKLLENTLPGLGSNGKDGS